MNQNLSTNFIENNGEERNYKAAIEAILFSMGESVPVSRIAMTLELEEDKVLQILEEMKADYASPERGIMLIELEGAYQLCTKQSYYEYLITLAMHPAKPHLTDVMMETLSIVAYRQPVTRSEIEKIRGVKSDFALNKLVEYNLVQELGRLDAPGRPILFGTTEEFLRSFGLDSKENLPELDPVQLADFQEEAQSEVSVDV